MSRAYVRNEGYFHEALTIFYAVRWLLSFVIMLSSGQGL